MKTPLLLFLFTTSGACAVAAQSSPQFGIEGGALRLKPAGTRHSDHIDQAEIPNSGSVLPSVFVVVPLTKRIGLESGLAASRSKFKESSGLFPTSSTTDIRLTVRADVAVTQGAYVAAGAMLRRHVIDGGGSTQTGLVGALGYQGGIGANLFARVEGRWVTQRKTDSIAPSNVYALLVGVSRRLGRPASMRAAADTGPFTPWRLQVGVTGGYVHNHFFGGSGGLYLDARETVIELPGTGATTPPPLFVDVPLAGRLAVELGFGAQRIQAQGSTLFNANLAPRLNVALYRGLYAAAGGNLWYVEQTGQSGFVISGANVAAGYRLAVARAFEGRVDVSYTAFKSRANFPFTESNLAVLLGVAMALQ